MRRLMILVACLMSSAAGASPADRWAAIGQPSADDHPRAIGGAAAGCIAGAVALPPDGTGYQVLRLERNRNWSHPRTIAFIQDLGRKAAADGAGPLLIGDLSQPRGGPMAYGHGSHQNGIDVDIWFRLPGRALMPDERSRPVPMSMVKGKAVDAKTWTPRHLKLLERAAGPPEVDRIFVNPAIKAAACRSAKGDRAWLAKLRPWWGHDEHFHVRLSCPPGDGECAPQASVPDGDGCGAELQSWLARPTILPELGRDKPNTRRPVLPEACTAILDRPARIPAAAR
ncbi:penicillin-insensitive murein endopeptidase [Magnetospirillum moscoviense]|uniref:Penicillin-insensitive murein endopeptidase n=1 Tax=Magnetospirillum moscoviense TaxID=1437059 RepID=A0A178MXZ6_9PROT|nr:penicillin-insensitive murein endopeptidase [Magnetospirillum moscoviense]OAN54400.1 penicillin-insensitive murein endopeptidase [Magnetospirillum moscoviense]